MQKGFVRIRPAFVAVVSLRYDENQANVLSITHLCRPNLLLKSLPLLTMRTRMPRLCRALLQCGKA